MMLQLCPGHTAAYCLIIQESHDNAIQKSEFKKERAGKRDDTDVSCKKIQYCVDSSPAILLEKKQI
jgi:hypothetical protein